ncbi:hypothetical protein [Arthrobacter castelli]|uniref:hypothetical protein n=1 Tax=Arthrobacter castelli TaxID=271431 RepID=UPI000421DF8D|nr:hypothetical protein [Arthrobacter castelli]
MATFVALGSGGLALVSPAFPQQFQLVSIIIAVIGIAAAGVLLGVSMSRRSSKSNADSNR